MAKIAKNGSRSRKPPKKGKNGLKKKTDKYGLKNTKTKNRIKKKLYFFAAQIIIFSLEIFLKNYYKPKMVQKIQKWPKKCQQRQKKKVNDGL